MYEPDKDHVGSKHVEDKQQHADERDRLAQPHLLILQVGIVFVQPSPVLSDGKYHIPGKDQAEQQEIASGI